jgi:D-alanyl-D-alanine carboxypeptidase/D-alanyl-D-alanine-endopeptidase (penicillin-binding protein 4)
MQNNLFKIILFISLTCWGLTANAVVPKSVAKTLKKMGIPTSAASFYVHEVGKKQPLITHNSNKAMNPASVMKLVTTYSALELLTPAFRWTTEVYRDGEVVNGVLQGNLIIKGHGDPSFKAQDFWRLLMHVKQAGIHSIAGDLVIDKSYFANPIGARRTFDNETWRAYNAEPSAFLVNGRNTSFRFDVAPDGRVTIAQEFELPEVTIINNMQLKRGGCGSWRSNYSYDVVPTGNGAQVTFTGKFSEKCGTRYLELSVMDDTQYAYYTFKKLWRELGGDFNGGLQVSTVPLNATKVVAQDSQPLGYVINDVNKWSVNVMARQLFLTTAAEQQQAPANEALGELTVNNWFASKGMKLNEFRVENGSGLSRTSRINAKHLGQMLVKAFNSPVMPELMSSMAVLGVDGTVKSRLKKAGMNGRAHLKTGTLNGVSAIAGYVFNKQGKRYVVVMLVNHKKTWGAKKAQDALIQWVYANH